MKKENLDKAKKLLDERHLFESFVRATSTKATGFDVMLCNKMLNEAIINILPNDFLINKLREASIEKISEIEKQLEDL